MSQPLPAILVVDDEPDIHAVTQLGLRALRFEGKRPDILAAHSGEEAVRIVADHPDVAVVLMDVIMETDTAGLDACRAIRQALGNRFVRIVLRTGQPGIAPERDSIDSFDIDGYLEKTDLTQTRLYSTVRTALKAWRELTELARHQRTLQALNHCALDLHAFDPLEGNLARIADTAAALCPSDLTVLSLDTFSAAGEPVHHLVQRGDADRAQALRRALGDGLSGPLPPDPYATHDGFLVPFKLPLGCGQGWLYVATAEPDELERRALAMLGGHAANALYANVLQSRAGDGAADPLEL